jgi:hypothetical protein
MAQTQHYHTKEWDKKRDAEAASRAVKEYLATFGLRTDIQKTTAAAHAHLLSDFCNKISQDPQRTFGSPVGAPTISHREISSR